MDFFNKNVEAWGAAEWFNRLATAIRQQDAAVLENDNVNMEICRNVAASSAMRLVREYEQQVRAALAATPAVGGEARGELTKIAAECHRAKWQFDLSEDYQPSKSSARALILQAFHELHRIGDLAMKARDAYAAQPASPLRGITDAMIEAGAKVHDPFAFDTDTSMPLHRAQSKDEARKEVRAILAAAFSTSPPEQPAAECNCLMCLAEGENSPHRIRLSTAADKESDDGR
jgi:hypothetical protein